MDDDDVLTDVDLLPTSELGDEEMLSGSEDDSESWDRQPIQIPGADRYRRGLQRLGGQRQAPSHQVSNRLDREDGADATPSSPSPLSSRRFAHRTLMHRTADDQEDQDGGRRNVEDAEMDEVDDSDLPTGLLSSDGPSSEEASLDTDEFDACMFQNPLIAT